MPVSRRHFLRNAGTAAIAAGGLSACAPSGQDAAAPTAASGPIRWKMVTAWPRQFPGLGTGATRLAEAITQASGGRLQIEVFAGGELVAPFEVFDAVSSGQAQMGHSSAYYWKSRLPAAPFFTTVPFGLSAQEMNAWLYHDEGLALWRELYAPFNLVPFPVGNTGAQMAGWSTRELTSLRDLHGMKMRIPGLGGEVMARVGATPVNLPGADIYRALQDGTLDAAEWMGPFNDLAFGLFRVAKYCYYPGWQEPGATIEAVINRQALEALPDELRQIVDQCCRAANDDLLALYTAENTRALATLEREHKVEFRKLPNAVIEALHRASDEVLEELARRDGFARRVWESYKAFRLRVRAYHAVSEIAFYQARG